MTGSSETTGGARHAFITGPDGAGMRDLGTLGEGSSWGSGINEAGQVVGEVRPYPQYDEYNEVGGAAFVTGPDGANMRKLGVEAWSGANAVNDAGQVVGVSYGKMHQTAFATGPGGMGVWSLAGANSEAVGINNAGQIAWNSSEFGTYENSRAFITDSNNVRVRDLDTLGGESEASGINASGQVVGWSETAPSDYRAFITGPNGVGMGDLGTLGGEDSWALGMNDVGQVVGWSDAPGDDFHSFIDYYHAFITGPDGESMADLNSLVDLPGSCLDPCCGHQ